MGGNEERRARLASGRSFLFVPGDRPDRFPKALAANADVIILDLEDSVSPDAKPAARAEVANWLKAGNEAVVRINDGATIWFEDDLELAALPGFLGFMLPKATGDAALSRTGERGPTIALIESALGVTRMDTILATNGVVRLAFGTIDLALDLDTTDEAVLRAIGIQLVVASRAYGAPPPVDGVTIDIQDRSLVK